MSASVTSYLVIVHLALSHSQLHEFYFVNFSSPVRNVSTFLPFSSAYILFRTFHASVTCRNFFSERRNHFENIASNAPSLLLVAVVFQLRHANVGVDVYITNFFFLSFKFSRFGIFSYQFINLEIFTVQLICGSCTLYAQICKLI